MTNDPYFSNMPCICLGTNCQRNHGLETYDCTGKTVTKLGHNWRIENLFNTQSLINIFLAFGFFGVYIHTIIIKKIVLSSLLKYSATANSQPFFQTCSILEILYELQTSY